jgi:ABC-type transport system substrate-binding protein
LFTVFKRWLSVLDKKEKLVFSVLLIFFLGSGTGLATSFYFSHTSVVPASGGSFVEGAVGQPRFINPVLSLSSDVDRDLTQLIFAGLLKYDRQGKIVEDLAKSFQVKDSGKTWEVELKENLAFSDGSPLTVDDVIFTVKAVTNPDYKSGLRPSWLGVEAEKISDSVVRFRLKNPYPGFAENLTLKIISKKVWEEILPENFALTIFNLKPLGAGPYRLEKINQGPEGKIESVKLTINPHYSMAPKIKEITFRFFESEAELVKSFRTGKVQNFVLNSPQELTSFSNEKAALHSFSLPRYFAVFFNQKESTLLNNKKIRDALNLATNKKEIVDRVLDNRARVASSPILPETFGFQPPADPGKFGLKKAQEILEKEGFLIDPETGFREKIVKNTLPFQFKTQLQEGSRGSDVKELQKCLARDPEIYPEAEVTGVFGEKTKKAVIRFQEKYRRDVLEPGGLEQGTGEVSVLTRTKLNSICFGPKEETLKLEISLATVDDPLLVEVANLLKTQWQKAGLDLKIKVLPFSELNLEVIKPRRYQALLFGEVLSALPDPLPFWHSLQKKDPGLNLALYENKDADKLLEEARQTLDADQKKQKLEKFQELVLKDNPAIFLFQPDFLYLTSLPIKGMSQGLIVDPSQRFAEIEKWHLETKRVWR